MRILTICIVILFTINVNAQFGKLLEKAKSELTGQGDDNTGLGLKEALNVGVSIAVDQLSAQDGYLKSQYKILIPEDAQKVIKVVKMVPGFSDVEDKLIAKMNQAAEIAAKKASPIFLNAIKQMTFADATNILFGADDAATRYLEKTTRAQLYKEFMPIIQTCLDEVNARSYWKTVVEAYNKIPLQKKMNPNLDDHVNDKALDGMFGLIELKEAGIRGDVNQRTSPLLKEVFGKLQKK